MVMKTMNLTYVAFWGFAISLIIGYSAYLINYDIGLRDDSDSIIWVLVIVFIKALITYLHSIQQLTAISYTRNLLEKDFLSL